MASALGPALPTLRRKLLAWYDHHRRDLPWRRDPGSAYHQWLAESMLQQTQVATVIPYYQRFVQRFPTVADLAAAPLDEVLRLWAGLGYYARARNLHRAAGLVSDELNGCFPDSVEGLRRLPGVGRYTAGAVASIAFGRRAPVLDGNVKRVLARLFAVRGSVQAHKTVQHLWALAEEVLPPRRCGDFNQGLMELGAMICTPAAPQCGACPLAAQCAAKAAGAVHSIRAATKRRRPLEVRAVVAAVEHRGSYLLRRRALDDLWGGLWELPSHDVPPGGSAPMVLRTLLGQLCRRGPSAFTIERRPLATVAHSLTHRRYELEIYRCHSRGPARPVRAGRSMAWAEPAQFARYALARVQQKVIAALLDPPAVER